MWRWGGGAVGAAAHDPPELAQRGARHRAAERVAQEGLRVQALAARRAPRVHRRLGAQADREREAARHRLAQANQVG